MGRFLRPGCFDFEEETADDSGLVRGLEEQDIAQAAYRPALDVAANRELVEDGRPRMGGTVYRLRDEVLEEGFVGSLPEGLLTGGTVRLGGIVVIEGLPGFVEVELELEFVGGKPDDGVGFIGEGR